MLKKLTARDENFYSLTLKIAGTSQCHYRMGAIIVKGNRILAVGVNVVKTHPIVTKNYQDHCVSIHAELNAIIRAQTDIIQSTLYVARDGGKVSKPCTACQELMKLAGIRTMVYSTVHGLVKERLYV